MGPNLSYCVESNFRSVTSLKTRAKFFAMASHTLPQDVLLRAVQPYRGRPINLGTPRGQSGKEMVTTFHLDHTQRRDEIYFFGSLISALRRCYRIHPRVPQAEASLVASNSITLATHFALLDLLMLVQFCRIH